MDYGRGFATTLNALTRLLGLRVVGRAGCFNFRTITVMMMASAQSLKISTIFLDRYDGIDSGFSMRSAGDVPLKSHPGGWSRRPGVG